MSSLKFIRKLVQEAKAYLDKGDTVQASEKLYKAAEETVKLLAKVRSTSEHEEACRRGRWTATSLFNAVERLSKEVYPKVRDWWTHARFLHVEGFHEARLTTELINARLPHIKKLIELTERTC